MDTDASCFLKIRTVFIIDPKKTIRLTIAYPASTGRNFDEIIRCVRCTAYFLSVPY